MSDSIHDQITIGISGKYASQVLPADKPPRGTEMAFASTFLMLNSLDCESSAAMATQSCSNKLFKLLHGTECRVDCPRCEWKLEAPEIVDYEESCYSSQSTFISRVTRL